MLRIVPHLWYDKEVKEDALFYTSLFDQSKILKMKKFDLEALQKAYDGL